MSVFRVITRIIPLTSSESTFEPASFDQLTDGNVGEVKVLNLTEPQSGMKYRIERIEYVQNVGPGESVESINKAYAEKLKTIPGFVQFKADELPLNPYDKSFQLTLPKVLFGQSSDESSPKSKKSDSFKISVVKNFNFKKVTPRRKKSKKTEIIEIVDEENSSPKSPNSSSTTSESKEKVHQANSRPKKSPKSLSSSNAHKEKVNEAKNSKPKKFAKSISSSNVHKEKDHEAKHLKPKKSAKSISPSKEANQRVHEANSRPKKSAKTTPTSNSKESKKTVHEANSRPKKSSKCNSTSKEFKKTVCETSSSKSTVSISASNDSSERFTDHDAELKDSKLQVDSKALFKSKYPTYLNKKLNSMWKNRRSSKISSDKELEFKKLDKSEEFSLESTSVKNHDTKNHSSQDDAPMKEINGDISQEDLSNCSDDNLSEVEGGDLVINVPETTELNSRVNDSIESKSDTSVCRSDSVKNAVNSNGNVSDDSFLEDSSVSNQTDCSQVSGNQSEIEKDSPIGNKFLIPDEHPAYELLLALKKYYVNSECLICGFIPTEKDFNAFDHMELHTLSNSFTSSYKCSCCDEKFSNPRNLYMHALSREKSYKYMCNICLLKFKRKHYLSRHTVKSH